MAFGRVSEHILTDRVIYNVYHISLHPDTIFILRIQMWSTHQVQQRDLPANELG